MRWPAEKLPLACNLWPLCFSCFRADGKAQLNPCWAGMTSSEFYIQPYWFAHYLLYRRPSCRSIIRFHFILLHSEYKQLNASFQKIKYIAVTKWVCRVQLWEVCLCEFISAFANAVQTPVLTFTKCFPASNKRHKLSLLSTYHIKHFFCCASEVRVQRNPI